MLNLIATSHNLNRLTFDSHLLTPSKGIKACHADSDTPHTQAFHVCTFHMISQASAIRTVVGKILHHA